MSEEWTCSRCSTVNAAEEFGCSNCGLLRHDIATVGSSAPDRVARPPVEEPTEPTPVEASELTVNPDVTTQSPTPAEVVAGWVLTGWRDGEQPQQPSPSGDGLPVGWLIFAVLIGGGAVTGWNFNAGRSGAVRSRRRAT